MSAVVAKIETAESIGQGQQLTPIQQESAIDRILAKALDSDVDLDRLEQLYALKRQYDADEARKAFAADLAEFKRNAPTILKDKHVKFQTSKGTTEYDHATIGNVVETIVASLGQFGFSHSWKPTQKDGKVYVKCILLHRLGHSDEVEMFASPDDSGSKNGIQAIASTKTYLERHTLLAITGMATKGQPDDDGRGAGDVVDSEARNIELAWIEQISNADTLEKHATTRQAIIDDYKGQANVPEVLRKALMARKRELTPAQEPKA